jgi:hypothetical protein
MSIKTIVAATSGFERKSTGMLGAEWLRHNETFCTRTHENGREQTEVPQVRIG